MTKNGFVFFIATLISVNMYAFHFGTSNDLVLKNKSVFPQNDKIIFVSSNALRNIFWDYNLGLEFKGNDVFSYTLGFGYFSPKTYTYKSFMLNDEFSYTTTEPGFSIGFQFRQYFAEVFNDFYWLSGIRYNGMPVIKNLGVLSGIGFFYAPVDMIALSVESGLQYTAFLNKDLWKVHQESDEIDLNFFVELRIGFLF